MPTIPETLINYEVYVDSTRYLGHADVELPEINFSTAEINGAGIAGKSDVPVTGFTESLELKINWRTLVKRPLVLLKPTAQKLSIRGAMQGFDSKNGVVKITAVKVDVIGRVKSTSLGKFSPANQTESNTTLLLDYLKISIDGNEVVEIDRYNFKYIVDGVDYLSDVRSALGL